MSMSIPPLRTQYALKASLLQDALNTKGGLTLRCPAAGGKGSPTSVGELDELVCVKRIGKFIVELGLDPLQAVEHSIVNSHVTEPSQFPRDHFNAGYSTSGGILE